VPQNPVTFYKKSLLYYRMAILNQILDIINQIAIGIISVAFLPQLAFIIFFFIRAKRYPEAKTLHKYAILIPCRNEDDVISDSINKIQTTLTYPRSHYDIFVVAHNCTDQTAIVAEKAGAKVIVYNNNQERTKGYALKHSFAEIIKQFNTEYEAFIIFDADTEPHPNYLTKMNNAFDSGTKYATCYLNAKNYTESISSSIWSLWYIRDSRFVCNLRSRINFSNIYGGHGMLIATEEIIEHGYDSVSIVEDAEYSMKIALRKQRVEYVSEAMVYDEHPATFKAIFARNRRFGYGLIRLFGKYGYRLIGRFFQTLNFSYIDLFLTLFFIPIAVMAVFWFPAYYGYLVAYNYIIGNNAAAWTIIFNLIMILAFAFIVPFIVQGALTVILEHKRINYGKWYKLIPSIVFLPMFMIIYCLAITIGVLTPKLKWKQTRKKKSDEKNVS